MRSSRINLSAAPSTLTLPDGSSVPMWGYSCGAVATGSTATCASLNSTAAAGSWSPVVITIPTGQALTINLTNNLSFAAGTGTNGVPTSLMIVGQIGGGLGDANQRTTTASPDRAGPGRHVAHSQHRRHLHASDATQSRAVLRHRSCPRLNGGADLGTERIQRKRRSAAAGHVPARWARPVRSGDDGIYGVLVVTAAPASATAAGTAYPGWPAGLGSSVVDRVKLIRSRTMRSTPPSALRASADVRVEQPSRRFRDPAVHRCYPPR